MPLFLIVHNAVLLDVRQADEFNVGHIDGAVLVPHDTIAEKIGTVVPDKNIPVYVYCRSFAKMM